MRDYEQLLIPDHYLPEYIDTPDDEMELVIEEDEEVVYELNFD